jgi:hypothetical protein
VDLFFIHPRVTGLYIIVGGAWGNRPGTIEKALVSATVATTIGTASI